MSFPEDRRLALGRKNSKYTYPTYHRRNNLTKRRSLWRFCAERRLAKLKKFLVFTWSQFSQWFKNHKGLIAILLLSLSLLITHPWSPNAVGIIRLKNDVTVIFAIIFEIAKISLILIMFGLLLLLASWLSGKSAGIIVLPFENLTGSTEAFLDGRGIANLIIAELHRIRYLHHDTPEMEHGVELKMQNFAPLSPNNENFEEGMRQVGSISFANSQIHLGSLLIVLRKLWPFGNSGKIISGSMQKYGRIFRIIARIEDHEVSAWEVRKEGFTPNDLPELVRELAFKIAIHLNSTLQVKSWKALYWFTEALAKYKNYKQSGKLEDLDLAFNFSCKAMEEEREYSKLSNLFCRIGVCFVNERKLDDAKNSFSKSLEIDATNVDAYNNLGNVFFRKDEIPEAFEAYNKAVYWDEMCPYPHNGLGNLYRKIGDYDQAQKSYSRAIQLDPSLWPPYANLGVIAQLARNIDQSLYFFKKAMQKSYTSPSISKISGLHNSLGLIYLMGNNLEQAEHELNAAICLDPKSCNHHGSLGLLFTIKGNEKKAKYHFDKAVSLGSDQGNEEFGDEFCLSLGFYRVMLREDSVVDNLKETIARADYLQKGFLKELLIDVRLVENSCPANYALKDLAEALENRIKDLEKVSQDMGLSLAEISDKKCFVKAH